MSELSYDPLYQPSMDKMWHAWMQEKYDAQRSAKEEKMATAYVFEEVPIGKVGSLYIDGNSKITVGNGSYENPKPNALSLPHISTCPGATSECMASCYVYGLQKNAPEVYKKYAFNEHTINKILLSESLMYDTSRVLGNWIGTNCPDGFRWHVSGDVMSVRHANWISRVVQESLGVRSWIYTRTFEIVPILALTKNLVVNISADAANYQEARKVATEHGLKVCYMTRDGRLPDDMREGEVIFPDYSLRGRDLDKPTEHDWWKSLSIEHKRMVCPPDFFGQSEQHRCGPCDKCLKPI
jgi:hypothetical protein